MRRCPIDLFNDADHFFKFRHERRFVLKTAGGVDDEKVIAFVPGALQRVERQARGIRARFGCDNLGARPLAPNLELLDGRGPERVARRQHDPKALAGELVRILADRRRFAGAIHTDDKDDVGLLRGVDFKRLSNRRENLFDFLSQDVPDFFRRDVAVVARFAQSARDAGRDIETEIGLNEQVFKLLQRLVVELALREDAADALREPRRRLRKPLAQLLKPAEARGLFRSPFLGLVRAGRRLLARIPGRRFFNLSAADMRPNTPPFAASGAARS